MRNTATLSLALLVAACVEGPGGFASAVAPEPAATVGATATLLSNQLLFYSRAGAANELFVANPDGSGRRQITSNQIGYSSVSLAPSGRRVVSHRSLGGGQFGIFVSQTDGREVRTLTTGHFDAAPAWSPAGGEIAFMRLVATPFGQIGRIFVMNTDGSNVRQVSADPPSGVFDFHVHPTWSPDGTRLAYCGVNGIVVMQADGTNARTLPFPSQGCNEPEWSSTGRIAVWANQGADFVVYAVKADGTGYQELLRGPVQPVSLAWAPNGGQLFLTLVVGGTPQLHRLSMEPGSVLQRISTSGVGEFGLTAVRSIMVP